MKLTRLTQKHTITQQKPTITLQKHTITLQKHTITLQKHNSFYISVINKISITFSDQENTG